MTGAQLARLRERHGFDLDEIAAATGLAVEIIAAVEAGEVADDETCRRVVRGILQSSSPSRVLELHRDEMRAYLHAQGLSRIRVFGSTARGEDRWNSDLDILARVPEGTSLFDLHEWEHQIAGGVRVDLVPESPGVLDRLAPRAVRWSTCEGLVTAGVGWLELVRHAEAVNSDGILDL